MERESPEQQIRLSRAAKDQDPKFGLSINQLGKLYKRKITGNTFADSIGKNISSGRKIKNFSRGKIASLSSGAFVRDVADNSRRVLIKSRIMTKAKCISSKPFEQIVKEHISYLQREGAGKDGLEPELFDGENDSVNAEDFANKIGQDRHHFRFIISPEDGGEVNLKSFTKDLIKDMEKDLGTKLEWVAVEHHNTDNPHVHVLLRGQTYRKKDLIIKPDYLSHGMRNRARKLLTMELGPRHELEVDRGILKSVTQERVLNIDHKIEENLDNGVLNLSQIYYKSDMERQIFKARLSKLTELKLAEPKSKEHNIYKVSENFKENLKNLEAQRNIYKRISRFGLTETRQFGTNPKVLIGKVLDKGITNELDDKHYVIVDGADGDKWYVDLANTLNSQDISVGNWLRLDNAEQQKSPKKSFRCEILAQKNLTKDLNTLKPTWADRALIFKNFSGETSNIGIGSQLKAGIKQRKQFLVEKKLAIEKGGRFSVVKGLLDKLRGMDIKQPKVIQGKEISLE